MRQTVTVTVIHPVEGDGVRHEPGAEIDLPVASARQLLALGVVEAVADSGLARDARRGGLAAACAALDPGDASRWTRSGVPQLAALRDASGLSDITAAERDAAWAAHQAQTHDPQSG